MKKYNIQAVSDALNRINSINFALIFGSAKDGILDKDDSDIDIAVYLNRKPDLAVMTDIIGTCQDAGRHEHIDISVLNEANYLLSFEALGGRLLFCRDREQYESFFSLICRIRDDEMMRIKKGYFTLNARVTPQ